MGISINLAQSSCMKDEPKLLKSNLRTAKFSA